MVFGALHLGHGAAQDLSHGRRLVRRRARAALCAAPLNSPGALLRRFCVFAFTLPTGALARRTRWRWRHDPRGGGVVVCGTLRGFILPMEFLLPQHTWPCRTSSLCRCCRSLRPAEDYSHSKHICYGCTARLILVHSVYHGSDGPEEHLWSSSHTPAACCWWTPALLDTLRNAGTGVSTGPAKVQEAGGRAGATCRGGFGLHQAAVPAHAQVGSCRQHHTLCSSARCVQQRLHHREERAQGTCLVMCI